MASQSKLQSATTPSSRLSPHAQPFMLSHRQLALVGVSASSVNDSSSVHDKAWYSSEEGLGFTEQNDGAVSFTSMDDDENLLRKENHAVEGSPLFGEVFSSLSRHLTDIPATQVACQNRQNQLKLNLKGAKEGHLAAADSFVVADKSQTDNEDPDVDSPCYKGKNTKKSPFIVSETRDAELTKIKPESSSVLNPKAPRFLPRAVERRSSAPVSMSFDKKKPPTSPPLFNNQVSWESTDVFNADSTMGYFAMLYESEQNSHIDNMGCLDDSVVGPNMALNGDGDRSVLTETLLELSKSLSTPVGVDADTLINAIHALSELLPGSCSGSFFPEERQLEKINRTINNLSLASLRENDGQSPSIHGSNMEFIQSYPTKSPHSSKFPGTELQPARNKVVISLPRPEVSNLKKYELQPARTKVVISPPLEVRKYELQKMGSSMIMQDFKSFSSDMGNEIAQATMKSSSSGYEIEHQMSPQASIYKDLWLQAKQELHSINKKAWRNTETYTT